MGPGRAALLATLAAVLTEEPACFECGAGECAPHEPGCEVGMEEELAERIRATFDAILGSQEICR